jgi:hypothetical protein
MLKTQHLYNHGQNVFFALYLTAVRARSDGSGVDGCIILKQWHGRELNFPRDKSRISITFRGTQGILSK